MKKLLVITIMCAFMSAPAFADMYGTVAVTYNGLIRGYSSLQVYRAGAQGTEYNVGLHSLNLGALDTSTGTHPLPGDSYLVAGLMEAFCIDLVEGFPSASNQSYDAVSLDAAPTDTYNVQTPMGDPTAKYVAQLLGMENYNTAHNAAATQTAIWEVMFETAGNPWVLDGTDTTNRGDFYLVGAVGSDENNTAVTADGWLSTLGQASGYTQFTALSETGKNAQDFVVVPVPAAILLGILGLGATGLGMRRFV
jgi:hypothetical protein